MVMVALQRICVYVRTYVLLAGPASFPRVKFAMWSVRCWRRATADTNEPLPPPWGPLNTWRVRERERGGVTGGEETDWLYLHPVLIISIDSFTYTATYGRSSQFRIIMNSAQCRERQTGGVWAWRGKCANGRRFQGSLSDTNFFFPKLGSDPDQTVDLPCYRKG